MSKKLVLTTVVILGAVAVLAAQKFLSRKDSSASDPATIFSPATKAGAALPVYTYRVNPRTLAEKIVANGTVLANESVDLQSEISGKIVALNFTEGSRVKKGDLLIKINDAELEAQLRRARYRIELAKTQAARQKRLLDQHGTTKEAYDSAVNEVKILEAEADLIQAQLDKTEIRAPFDGLIGLRYVSDGSYLTPATRIATLQDVDSIKVDFSVSEKYMARVHPGTVIRFTVAGQAGSYPGEVYAVEPKIDLATRTILLRARATNAARKIVPGAFASVEVTLDEIPNALLIPTNAIIPGLDQKTAYVIEDGKATARTITTGIRLEKELQILSGLQPGDIVITSGILQLRPGLPVEPLAEKP